MRLTDDQVRQLRERAARGESQLILAREYGLRPSAVSQIVTGNSRPHAPGPISMPRPGIRWTPERVALLGTMTDAEVAARVGGTIKAVRAQRGRLGIAEPEDPPCVIRETDLGDGMRLRASLRSGAVVFALLVGDRSWSVDRETAQVLLLMGGR